MIFSSSASSLLAMQTTYAIGTAGIIAGAESYAITTTSSDGGRSIAYYDNSQRAVRGQAKAFDGTFGESPTAFDAGGAPTATSSATCAP